jgi:hypothetical protein
VQATLPEQTRRAPLPRSSVTRAHRGTRSQRRWSSAPRSHALSWARVEAGDEVTRERSPVHPLIWTDRRHLDRRQVRALRGARHRGRRTLAHNAVSLGRTRRSTAHRLGLFLHTLRQWAKPKETPSHVVFRRRAHPMGDKRCPGEIESGFSLLHALVVFAAPLDSLAPDRRVVRAVETLHGRRSSSLRGGRSWSRRREPSSQVRGHGDPTLQGVVHETRVARILELARSGTA